MTDYRKRRQELGLTIAQVAEMTGISERGIAYIESGARSPRLEQWYNLCSVLFDGNDGAVYFTWNPVRLWEVRTSAGLRQEDLAKLIGVTKKMVTRWENPKGTSIPTVKNLNRICEIFLMLPKEFLEEKTRETAEKAA